MSNGENPASSARKRGKLVLIRPPVLLLLLPHGGAMEDIFAQSLDPYPPLCGSRCSRALHKLPPRLYSFLRLTATHLAFDPKENHLARPRRACRFRHMGNQNRPPADIPDPCAESAHLSDPPSPLSGIVGQVFGVFSAQWLSQSLRQTLNVEDSWSPCRFIHQSLRDQLCKPKRVREAFGRPQQFLSPFPRTTGAT